MNWGILLKQKRKSLGLSQEELALKLGTVKGSISKYELGQTTRVSHKIGLALSEFLGVNIYDDIYKSNEDAAKEKELIFMDELNQRISIMLLTCIGTGKSLEETRNSWLYLFPGREDDFENIIRTLENLGFIRSTSYRSACINSAGECFLRMLVDNKFKEAK